MYPQHKPENVCMLLHVDPESRPQNFLFTLWIVSVHKEGHIYEQKQQQPLKNNILRIKN